MLTAALPSVQTLSISGFTPESEARYRKTKKIYDNQAYELTNFSTIEDPSKLLSQSAKFKDVKSKYYQMYNKNISVARNETESDPDQCRLPEIQWSYNYEFY